MKTKFSSYFREASCNSNHHFSHISLGHCLDKLTEEINDYFDFKNKMPCIDRNMIERLKRHCILPETIVVSVLNQIDNHETVDYDTVLRSISVDKLIMKMDAFPLLSSIYRLSFMHHNDEYAFNSFKSFITQHLPHIVKWEFLTSDFELQQIRDKYGIELGALAERFQPTNLFSVDHSMKLACQY